MNAMRHTGIIFLSKARPQVDTTSQGVFQLQLFALDRIGAHQVEPWRLLWTGALAQQFHQQHRTALVAGAALRVECQAARAHQCGRVGAEIVAHVITCEIAPQRLPSVRKQLLNQEQEQEQQDQTANGKEFS